MSKVMAKQSASIAQGSKPRSKSYLMKSIGKPKEQLQKSKIKDSVGHVGPSHQPVLSKVLISLQQKASQLSPNSNWLIAPKVTGTMDAEVAGSMDLSSTQLTMELL